jgi:hypothetical protein
MVRAPDSLIVTIFGSNGALDRESKACNFCHGNVIFYSSHLNSFVVFLIDGYDYHYIDWY